MVDAGAEILVETARFWASRARTEADGHAHIRAVIGPDEYHETVDDNAYTNVMAQWNLNRAADAVAILKREQPADWKRLSARLALTEDEPAAWQRVAAALVTGFHPDTGLFEQFEGYFGLEESIGTPRGRSTSSSDGRGPAMLWLRFALYDEGEPLRRRLDGKVDRVGLSGTNLTSKNSAGQSQDSRTIDLADHRSAVHFCWIGSKRSRCSLRSKPWDTGWCTG